MPQDSIIALQNISKRYKRYHHPVDRLREALFSQTTKAEEFWALKAIDLEISQGDTVGIIGRNGSGKSTLLQIIASTLKPTTGQVDVRGRVSALLELGSGFNPEFTGRQNAFFNGRVLGLSQAEIAARFDDIVAFADIGHFIDQPVKTYSSGMFVRLAFAVAINVDPEILIIDEALSVGDEAFQRKCFARIHDMQKQGVTVLFVSHSARSIVELCTRAVLIDSGEILIKGTPKLVVAHYHQLVYAPSEARSQLRADFRQAAQQTPGWLGETEDHAPGQSPTIVIDPQHRARAETSQQYDPYLVPQHRVDYPSQGAKIQQFTIKTLDDQQVNILCRGQRYRYSYAVTFSQAAAQVSFGMLIKTISGVELGGMASHPLEAPIDYVAADTMIEIVFEFTCLLLPGTYFLNAGVLSRVDGEAVYLDRVVDAAMFRVQPESEIRATGIVDFQIKAHIRQSSQAL
ncbi:MAG: ABC transporter ATP-binding protein [Leptolyngbyaceae cyanobacterium]